MIPTLRIGTRGSALAVAQSQQMADKLIAAGAQAELVIVSTPGDRSMAPIAEIGVGVFTNALRDALAAGEVDVAIHSNKDLPSAPDPRLSMAAIPKRVDPRDVLVARDGLTLSQLPPGAKVGTGSPRRASQLAAVRPDLQILPLRGNVDTRIRKVHSGELDAVVLAFAGLSRLNRAAEATEIFEPEVMLPAPAQGALAIECRVDDLETEHLLSSILDDAETRVCVAAERAMLATLEAGCSAPIGALAEVVADGTLLLTGVAATPDNKILRTSASADTSSAIKLGAAVANELLDLGAAVLSSPNNT
jgi:hydroxymethylbilane synthase